MLGGLWAAAALAVSNGAGNRATQIAYTPGEGRFGGWRASEDQVRALQQTLQGNGWRARFDGNELALSPPAP